MRGDNDICCGDFSVWLAWRDRGQTAWHSEDCEGSPLVVGWGLSNNTELLVHQSPEGGAEMFFLGGDEGSEALVIKKNPDSISLTILEAHFLLWSLERIGIEVVNQYTEDWQFVDGKAIVDRRILKA
jgi:hypothetical protein